MPPHSKSDMGCEAPKCDEDILEISDKLKKIDIQTIKTEDEECTYNIEENDDSDDENESTSDLKNCATIKKKGPSRNDRSTNNRSHPFSRNSTSGGQLIYNEIDDNILFNNIIYQNPINDGFSFNDYPIDVNSFLFDTDNATFNENNALLIDIPLLNDNNNRIDYSYDDAPLIINENSSSNELQLLTNDQHNIPVVIEQCNFAETSTNRAEQALSNHIDQNKKLKQIIWIKVNTQIENDLIATLGDKISSARFTETELNYIYAIIIRLMKKDCDVDGKRLLLEYFANDADVLLKIAIKGDVLLMDFILEVIQNLRMDLNQFNLLHQIVSYSHVDLHKILDNLLNKTFDNKPSLNIFNVNCIDAAQQTILMIVVRNLLMNRGLFDVNMKYLDLILRRIPDVTYVTQDGRNVFQDVVNCARHEDIVQKFLNYYDRTFIENMMSQIYNGWGLYQQ